MSLQVIETGELIEEMSRVEAERITSRIADKLDTIADNLEQVLPLIGEALTRKAWDALGYASPTAYVSARFAGALTRLPVEVRRPVVAELSAAGMSTRAIAPIVGTTQKTVVKDTQAARSQVIPEVSPARESSQSEPPAPLTDEPGQVIKLTGSNSVVNPGQELPRSENIIGMDGKEYKRPEPESEKMPAQSVPEQIRERVNELASSGMSSRGIAEELGVSKTTVLRAMNGKDKPTKGNKTNEKMDGLMNSLWGIRQAVQAITELDSDLDPDQVAAWIKELAQTSQSLNTLRNKFKENI